MSTRLDVEQLGLYKALTDLSAALCGTTAPAPTPPDPIPTLNPPITSDPGPVTLSQSKIETQKSKIATGPRTPEGKARSSQNALKHGLTSATSALMPTEDPAEYAQFCQDMHNDLRPRPGLESALVERIIQFSWRLRRVPAAEAALFDHAREVQLYRLKGQNARRQYKDPDIPPLPEPPESAAGALAALYAHCDDKTNPFARLARYEAHLDRALARALKQLHDLQRRPDQDSCGAGVPPASSNLQNELSPATATATDNGPLTTDNGPLPPDLQNKLPVSPHPATPEPPKEAKPQT